MAVEIWIEKQVLNSYILYFLAKNCHTIVYSLGRKILNVNILREGEFSKTLVLYIAQEF